MGGHAADGQGGIDLQHMQGHSIGDELTKHWQNVAADSWLGIKPSEAQLNKPVELGSIPLPTTHERADEIADHVAGAGKNGTVWMPSEGDVMHGGPATNAIYSKIADATRPTTSLEIAEAKKVFNSLSPTEQGEVQKEAQMRHINLLDGHKQATPHFDAYERAVEKSIAPLENERTVQARKILTELPKDLARDKQQEDFFHQHIKAL